MERAKEGTGHVSGICWRFLQRNQRNQEIKNVKYVGMLKKGQIADVEFRRVSSVSALRKSSEMA